jgi:hypothetical protein
MELTMSFSSWLQNCNSKPRTSRRAISTYRPQLEVLECRDVPSTLTVTNNFGFGTGSLRDEIGIAQSGDTIVFEPSLRGQTIDIWSNAPFSGGGSYEIDITKSLDIEGLGASNLAINGAFLSRVFRVTAGAQVTLSGLTIEYGSGTTGAYDPAVDDGLGGSILNYGTLTVTGCVVTGDSVNTNAAFYGGGIYNAGTLTVSGSTVTHNIARYAGGGIYNAGTLAVLNSSVIDNTAADGADIFNVHHCNKKK